MNSFVWPRCVWQHYYGCQNMMLLVLHKSDKTFTEHSQFPISSVLRNMTRFRKLGEEELSGYNGWCNWARWEGRSVKSICVGPRLLSTTAC